MKQTSLMETGLALKQCTKCHRLLPATQEFFHVNRRNRNGLQAQCQQCHSQKQKDWHREPHGGTCSVCGKPLRGKWEIYCSKECRVVWKLGGIGARYGRLTVIGSRRGQQGKGHARFGAIVRCDCGTEKMVMPGNLRRKKRGTQSCGCWERERPKGGENAPGWRGGRFRNTHGYMMVYKPGFRGYRKGNYVPEHWLVMEEAMGGSVNWKRFKVHHKNGVRDDNRAENLELWERSHPQGQSIADSLADIPLALLQDEVARRAP